MPKNLKEESIFKINLNTVIHLLVYTIKWETLKPKRKVQKPILHATVITNLTRIWLQDKTFEIHAINYYTEA